MRNLFCLTKPIGLVVGLAIATFSTTNFVNAADEFKISGSTGAVKTILVPNKDAIEAEAGVSLTLAATGSSKGVRYLAEGKIDLAILSASAEKVINKLNGKDQLNLKFEDFQQVVVHEQELAIVINSRNPVNSITRRQLHDIFTGSITNWSEVGGNDEAIVVITEEVGSGVRTLLESSLLDKGEKFSSDAKKATNSVQSSSFIKGIPTAISAASPINVGSNKLLKITGAGPVKQFYYLVTKGKYATNPIGEKVRASIQKATRYKK